MGLNKILKVLVLFTLAEMFISIILLFYYSVKPDVGLGIFVIAFVFISTAIYYFILYVYIRYLLKNKIRTGYFRLIFLIISNVIPIIVHLSLLDLI